MKTIMTRSKSFWRGFGSAFDLFPNAVRQDRRIALRTNRSANVILMQAWESVGNSIYLAMGEYDDKEEKANAGTATESAPSKAA